MSATDAGVPPPDGGPQPPASAAAAAPIRPSPGVVVGWVVLVGLAVALDGLVGGFTLVVIAAVLLAGLPPRLLGGLGVVALLLVPVALLAQGLPADQQISPAFVFESLVPHHLTFAGLVLVCASALIDLAPHLKTWAAGEHPVQDDGPPLGPALGIAVVAVVAVGALVACWAVLGA